ncbi:MAG: O-antigen polymerase [Candidatus Hodarchaeales archaeon]
MAIELSFILYHVVWMIPFFYPYLFILIVNHLHIPGKKAGLAVLASFVVYFIFMIVNTAFSIFYLSSYGGEFVPSNELNAGVFIYASTIGLQAIILLAVLLAILELVKPFIESSSLLEEESIQEIFVKGDEKWFIAVILSWLTLLTLFVGAKLANIAYVNKYLAFWIGFATMVTIILFVGASIIVALLLGRTIMTRVDMSNYSSSNFVYRYIIYIACIILGLGFITIMIHEFMGLGISIISGEEFYFPVIYAIVVAAILLVLLFSPDMVLSKKAYMMGLTKIRGIRMKIPKFYLGRLITLIMMVFFIWLPLMAVPVMMSVSPLESSRLALESNVVISNHPVEEYPVNLSNLRVVSRSLAKDISLSRLPSPPKSYALQVLSEYEAIGMIDNRPAWIIPMRYESFFNIETNILAGYIAVYLDDPIPEHIEIVFYEMVVGPGLTGFRDIKWLVSQERPRAKIGEICFMDPYLDGNPAWLVVLDKYNSWGLRVADTIMVVHGDGTHEFISHDEALALGFPEVLSEYAFKNIATRAGLYLRNGLFDPTAQGLITIPPSPDRMVDLYDETEYYLFPHHFLTGENRSWFGRLYYQEATTGDRESVVVYCTINGTVTLYDLRNYSRGGARGVNTPDKVMNDLRTEITVAFSSVGSYYIQQPTLYRTIIENNSILVWVSLIVESKQGADELVGAAFIDAANTRIVGVKSRAVGEPLDVFKDRLIETIQQTYLSFGVDEQAGESQTIIIENGTILGKEWTGFDSESRKTYVLRVRDESTGDSYHLVIKWSESGTGADYYRAAVSSVGERYYFKARFDKDEQVFVMINCQEIT